MVLDWLGSYFIEHQVAEKALGYFERAALMQPSEVKWQLMAASCHRRSGNYHQALQAYKDIHARFPENIECEYYVTLHGIVEYGIYGY
jgi:intraflagellar transport protein 88